MSCQLVSNVGCIELPKVIRSGLTLWVYGSNKIIKVENADQLEDGTYSFSIPTSQFDLQINHRDHIELAPLTEAEQFYQKYIPSEMKFDNYISKQIQARICENENEAIKKFNEQPSVKNAM